MSLTTKTLTLVPGTTGASIATLAGLSTDAAIVSEFGLIGDSANTGGAFSWGRNLSELAPLGDWNFGPVPQGRDLSKYYLKTGAANDIVYLVIPATV